MAQHQLRFQTVEVSCMHKNVYIAAVEVLGQRNEMLLQRNYNRDINNYLLLLVRLITQLCY